jgi:hypothetical protein
MVLANGLYGKKKKDRNLTSVGWKKNGEYQLEVIVNLTCCKKDERIVENL